MGWGRVRSHEHCRGRQQALNRKLVLEKMVGDAGIEPATPAV
jgi:hypothetical protein